MRVFRSAADDAGEPGDGEPDAEVRSRFIRVVGLPQVDGPASPGLGPASPGLSPASPGLGPTSPGLSPVDGRASLCLTPAPPGGALSSALDPRRRGIRALAVVAVVVVTVAATLAWWSRPRIEAVPAVTRPTGPPASEASTVIVVAVAGRVVRPGLVRLPAGSRVADAIEAAGGVLPGTDLSYVNLARKLTDGELIVIGGTPPPGDAGGAAPPGGPVNLNTATLAQLDALPGVGPVLAARGGLYLTAGCGVVVAACAALAAGGAAFAAGRAALAVGLPAGGAAHPAGWRRGRRLPGGWLPVGLLLGVVCGAASTAARVATREAEPLAGLARDRATVTVDLVVTDDPHPLRGSAGRPATYAVPAELMGLRHDSGSARLSARVLVLASDRAWRTLLPGQRVTTVGRLGPPRRGDLRAAVLSASHAPLEIGEPPWAQRAAGRLRAGLQRACEPLPAEPGGLLPGLVVGDTSRLEPAVADDFTTTGMTHLVAVSGSNVAIVIGFVLLVTRWARAGPRLAALLCALALVGFVILVRPSPSVLRAAAMGGLGLVALALGRPRAAVPALAASAAVLVMVDPQLAADAGFALSVLATAGLLLIAPGWRDALRERGVPAGLAESLAIPAAAQVACAPVIAAISGTVGLAAIPANLVAVPAVAPATVLGVAAALLSACWPAAAEWVAWLAGWPAWWLVLVARYGADAPAGVAPWPAGVVGGMLLAALLAVVLVAGRRPVVRRLVAVAAVATVVGVLPVRVVASGWPPPGWFVVACDVGQGDAVVLPVGPDQAAVVDAGPDPAATDRCLRGLGVRHVNLLLITHFHADHVGGFAGVFRGRSVAEVVTTGHPEPAAGRDAVLAGAAAEGVPVRAATAGAVYRLGGVQLFVLGPVRPLTGTRSDPNNNSLVVRAEIRGRRVLLAGDAEEDEQRGVLSAAGPSGVRADVLKLAHHGSVYQDAGFLDAVAPAVALVSVGAGNPYGHPNTAVLGRLARGGARVLRTDVDADVAVVVTPGGLAVVARGQRPGRRPP